MPHGHHHHHHHHHHKRGRSPSLGEQSALKYRFDRRLGEGGEGHTDLCTRVKDGKKVVRKTFDLIEPKRIGKKPLEAIILEDILPKHKNILKIYSYSLEGNNRIYPIITYKYYSGGTLRDHYSSTNRPSERFMWDCFVQIADALAFLHYGYDRKRKHPEVAPRGWQRIVHRDIKLDNVFIRKPISHHHPHPKLVLGDFGCATTNIETYFESTLSYHGPEYPYQWAISDVWALGVIIHKLGRGQGVMVSKPDDFEGTTREWEKKGRARQPKQLDTRYSDKLNRNMMDCFVRKPEDRVRSKDLVRHLVKDRPHH